MPIMLSRRKRSETFQKQQNIGNNDNEDDSGLSGRSFGAADSPPAAPPPSMLVGTKTHNTSRITEPSTSGQIQPKYTLMNDQQWAQLNEQIKQICLDCSKQFGTEQTTVGTAAENEGGQKFPPQQKKQQHPEGLATPQTLQLPPTSQIVKKQSSFSLPWLFLPRGAKQKRAADQQPQPQHHHHQYQEQHSPTTTSAYGTGGTDTGQESPVEKLRQQQKMGGAANGGGQPEKQNHKEREKQPKSVKFDTSSMQSSSSKLEDPPIQHLLPNGVFYTSAERLAQTLEAQKRLLKKELLEEGSSNDDVGIKRRSAGNGTTGNGKIGNGKMGNGRPPPAAPSKEQQQQQQQQQQSHLLQRQQPLDKTKRPPQPQPQPQPPPKPMPMPTMPTFIRIPVGKLPNPLPLSPPPPPPLPFPTHQLAHHPPIISSNRASPILLSPQMLTRPASSSTIYRSNPIIVPPNSPHKMEQTATKTQEPTLRPMASSSSLRSHYENANHKAPPLAMMAQPNSNIGKQRKPPAQSKASDLDNIFAYKPTRPIAQLQPQQQVQLSPKMIRRQVAQQQQQQQHHPQQQQHLAGRRSKSKSPIKQQQTNNELEWVVKRRPDGTRYVTRRPMRKTKQQFWSAVVKARREQSLLWERQQQSGAVSTTTDDDGGNSDFAASNRRRQWMREQRRRHKGRTMREEEEEKVEEEEEKQRGEYYGQMGQGEEEEEEEKAWMLKVAKQQKQIDCARAKHQKMPLPRLNTTAGGIPHLGSSAANAGGAAATVILNGKSPMLSAYGTQLGGGAAHRGHSLPGQGHFSVTTV